MFFLMCSFLVVNELVFKGFFKSNDMFFGKSPDWLLFNSAVLERCFNQLKASKKTLEDTSLDLQWLTFNLFFDAWF